MNRRAFLSGSAAASVGLMLASWGAFEAAAQGPRTFSRIVVDTAPLEARGARGAAAVLRPRLQRSLQMEMAGRIGRGPVLIARVQTLLLSSFSGGADRHSGTPSDYLEGEAIVGPERIPMLVTLPSDSGGTWYLPGFDERRMHALADGFASWIARRV